jgi:HK97 family phage major capsid protein
MTLSSKLKEQRDALVAEVETTIAAEEVTAEALTEASAKQEDIVALDERIATAEAVEARSAAIAESRKESKVLTFGGATVTREAHTYEERGSNSFVRDLMEANLRGNRDAYDRLARHQKEVAIETRDISRTDGSGGDFVPPLYLINEYAEFARASRVGADLLTNMALPAGTDSINVPALTTGTLAAFQAADNTATTTRDMVSSTVTAPVRTISGYENVSIQLVEQSPLAGGLDRLVFGDLMADYALQLNTAVMGANSTASGGSVDGLITKYNDTTNSIPVTWTETTPTAVNGLKAIAQAISKVTTNRFKAAEAIIMHPSMWYWFVSQVDGSNRPLVVPIAGGSQAFNASGINNAPGAAAGLVGTILGVPVYIDATITKTLNSNQSPIFVGKFSDSYLFESGVKTRVLPDVLSANLTVRFQVYGYTALAHRFAKSVSVISGTGTVAPSGY